MTVSFENSSISETFGADISVDTNTHHVDHEGRLQGGNSPLSQPEPVTPASSWENKELDVKHMARPQRGLSRRASILKVLSPTKESNIKSDEFGNN